MGIPTLQGLQTALSGLMANQDSLDVTGQNIANAQTPGYSRQTAVLETREPLRISALSPTTGQGAQLGTGVGVETIVRIRDTYLDSEYRTDNSAMGSASTLAETLEQVQSALEEPSSSGLSSQLSSFWSSWNDLADSPTSAAAKEAVVSAGGEVATTVKQLSAQITAAETEVTERYEALMGGSGEVRSDAEQIAQLNGQIKSSEQAGQPPNELLDRRDELIDQLSKLAQVSVSEGEYGVDTISFGGSAEPLIEGSTVNWPPTLSASSGGELGALLNLAGPEGKLAELQEKLNVVAEALTSSVNALQPSVFFSFAAGEAAASLEVSASAEQLRAGSEGEPGANNFALKLAGLRGGEAEQLYTAFVTGIGSDVQTAQASEGNAEAMLSAIAAQRQSVSGVSLDEEMTNLMTFQRGYEASARVLTAMDSLLETLIEHTGTVGL
ncbi:MAG TPA: flagellar hook-associated protein FlgK [Solirubrobacteraceae bacterium]|jgi:flagellar hook-associated protein 1 FlgK